MLIPIRAISVDDLTTKERTVNEQRRFKCSTEVSGAA